MVRIHSRNESNLRVSRKVGHLTDFSSFFFPISLGECREVMTNYLACMKKVRGVNKDECRELAKSYLACRMDK